MKSYSKLFSSIGKLPQQDVEPTVLKILGHMKHFQISPNTVIFNAIIDSLRRTGNMEVAEKYLQYLESNIARITLEDTWNKQGFRQIVHHITIHAHQHRDHI